MSTHLHIIHCLQGYHDIVEKLVVAKVPKVKHHIENGRVEKYAERVNGHCSVIGWWLLVEVEYL